MVKMHGLSTPQFVCESIRIMEAKVQPVLKLSADVCAQLLLYVQLSGRSEKIAMCPIYGMDE
jgi:hypothetical protein